MRSVFLIGVGSFGFHFARKLEKRARVTAVDRDRRAIQRVGPYVEKAVVADATKREVLEELGVQHADAAVVSLGDRMEASILAAFHLKSFNVPEIYVKAVSEEHARILEIIGAHRVIYPEREVAENLAVSILNPAVADYLRLHENLAIIEVVAPEEYWDKSLLELDLRGQHSITVVAIYRQNGEKLVNPPAATLIQRGDKLMILGTEVSLMSFQSTLEEKKQ